MADDAPPYEISEERLVYINRYGEAQRAGLIPEECKAFAESDYDIGKFRALVKAGCPLEHLRMIVL